MITVEYIGLADRQVGVGDVHEVRAHWHSVRDSEGDVKQSVSMAVRGKIGKGGSAVFDSWEVDTYKSPSLSAIVRVRVLTDEQLARRKELKSRRYHKCALCPGEPVELVRRQDGTEQPLCFYCRRGLGEEYQVTHWINRDGKLHIN